MIVLEGLTKHYGELEAVSDLSLKVRPGEIYALLGPNGAGKTTALRCIATLLKPTSGTASVGGADVQQDPLRVKSRIGFLAASMGLYERLSARELVTYFGRLQGLEEDRLQGRVDELAALFGLDDFRGRYCGKLSTGQRQRVALARAIVHDPSALILDEPTHGLDVLSGETIYRFMAEERERGKAILFSTHQMAEVELLADRVGVLSRGRLVAEGTVEGLVQRTGAGNSRQGLPCLWWKPVARPVGRDFRVGSGGLHGGEGGMRAPKQHGWRYARVVFRKEMRETLRDTRTLIIMVVVPVLLYPAILIARSANGLVRPAPAGAGTGCCCGGRGCGLPLSGLSGRTGRSRSD